MLISLDNERERMLRELARKMYGGKKGSLSNAAGDAIEMEYVSRLGSGKKAGLKRFIALVENGWPLGIGTGRAYKSREELYAGRIKDTY